MVLEVASYDPAMGDWLPVVTGVAGLLTGGVGVWAAVSTARERRQPIVVAHEDRARTLSGNGGFWFARAHVTNESGPAAFNVRFGGEYGGVRFPYRMRPNDPESGNLQRVIQPGARLPAPSDASFPIAIASQDIWATAAVRGGLDATAVYWCRYENALGQTWETRNPAD